MYVGRIVCVAMTEDRRLCAGYRVSSRSFPNRTAVVEGDSVRIVPKPGHEADVQRNPYIAYNCLRIVQDGRIAVVTNGSQTDPIAEKIAAGMPIRDALALALLALDYEKDDYNTPRIAAVVDKTDEAGWLGVVRHDGLEVRRFPLRMGQFHYVATYEENTLSEEHGGLDYIAETAEEACTFLFSDSLFVKRTNPVSAVAVMAANDDFDVAALDYQG